MDDLFLVLLSVLTSLASVYLGGGCVKCCFGSISIEFTCSPSSKRWKIRSFSSSLIVVPSTYTFINPGNLTCEPFARKRTSPFTSQLSLYPKQQVPFDLQQIVPKLVYINVIDH